MCQLMTKQVKTSCSVRSLTQFILYMVQIWLPWQVAAPMGKSVSVPFLEIKAVQNWPWFVYFEQCKMYNAQSQKKNLKNNTVEASNTRLPRYKLQSFKVDYTRKKIAKNATHLALLRAPLGEGDNRPDYYTFMESFRDIRLKSKLSSITIRFIVCGIIAAKWLSDRHTFRLPSPLGLAFGNPWGYRHQTARRRVRDRAPSRWKVPAKSVQQFKSEEMNPTQTDSKANLDR